MRAKKPSNFLLGVASGISPFGMAIAIPTIESFAQLYQAPYSTVQFIISAYLLGLASSMPLVGFLSDKIGRRPVLYIRAYFVCRLHRLFVQQPTVSTP